MSQLRGLNGGARVPPPSVIPDRFGNLLTPGDLVLFHPQHDLVFHVQQITPALDPKMPPGAVQLVLTCTVPLMLPSGQPQPSMTRVGHAEPQTAQEPASDRQAAPDGLVDPETAPEPTGEAPDVLTAADVPDTKVDTVEPEA